MADDDINFADSDDLLDEEFVLTQSKKKQKPPKDDKWSQKLYRNGLMKICWNWLNVWSVIQRFGMPKILNIEIRSIDSQHGKKCKRMSLMGSSVPVKLWLNSQTCEFNAGATIRKCAKPNLDKEQWNKWSGSFSTRWTLLAGPKPHKLLQPSRIWYVFFVYRISTIRYMYTIRCILMFWFISRTIDSIY